MKQCIKNTVLTKGEVLIGPCGIETKMKYPKTLELRVLIGPCGIETDKLRHDR